MLCCEQNCETDTPQPDGKYRRILWVALALNAAMFLGEIAAGLSAGSSALQADAVDFLSDAANYAISLFVIGSGPLWRSRAALIKGGSMGLLGLWVLFNTLRHALLGTLPQAEVMGIVGVLALLVNGGVALMLYHYRSGDANMRSVWICSRNDAIGNVAVMLAALGVFGTGTGWPDIIVASMMAALAVCGAYQIVNYARKDLKKYESNILFQTDRSEHALPQA